ncbi:inverse autotransporter beta domain-containing protein [Vagococcus sp. WN89Y]|uniref:inverse autotransporter beta domain-containing protein n=1 Tax=Vagococcus sp. WN89Y TaxID=3457258 RepID=UPI003FCE0521
MKKAICYFIIPLLFLLYAIICFPQPIKMDEQTIAQSSAELAQVLQSKESTENTKRLLASKIATHTIDELNNSLQRFGSVQAQLSIDDKFSLHESSLDVLFPFYNSQKNLLFTQWGGRQNDKRIITNVGVGHRHFTDHGWMFGYNAFYDVDWHNNNRRYGIGFESWRDYLKITANGYKRLSDWRNSPNIKDYQERPSDGWDARIEGWLPAFPQLGGKLIYEKYYGDNVALLDKSTLQKNPSAITAGITYTPFPLLTAGIDYRRGKSGIDDVRFNVSLTHRLGESLKQQLTSGSGAINRSLASNRLELVSRNNAVVLDYRKQTIITLQFPPTIQGEELTTITISPQVKAKYGLSRISLDDTELRQAGGGVISNTPQQLTLQLPAWSEQQQSVSLSGRAWDTHGNASEIAYTRIIVNRPIKQRLSLTTDKTTAIANGQDIIHYTLTVTDSEGKPVSGQAVSWQNSEGILQSDTITNETGTAKARLSSNTPGVIQVSATSANQSVTSPDVKFMPVTNTLTLLADKTWVKADGADQVNYTLTLKNMAGQPVMGNVIKWSTNLGTLTAAQTLTDSKGEASVSLTSLHEGTAIVNAIVDDQKLAALPVNFTRIIRGEVRVEQTRVYPKTTQTITLTITDAAGSPITGESVRWHTGSGILKQSQNTTDSSGRSVAVWESDQPGSTIIKAEVNGQYFSSPQITTLSALAVTSIIGIDATGAEGKNFGTRIPNNTWHGAKFKINTTNAAGTVTWQASSSAVSVDKNVVTVINNPRGVTLTGTDTHGQKIKLKMGNNWFAQTAIAQGWLNIDIQGSAIRTCKTQGASFANKGQLQSLIYEWNDLHKYPGWTSLAHNWLFSSTTITINITRYVAFFVPSQTTGDFSVPYGYYACISN